MNDDMLYKLYLNERHAYHNYVSVMSGDAKVTGQRVSEASVRAARRLWLVALSRVQDEASWPEVRAMLARRGDDEANH